MPDSPADRPVSVLHVTFDMRIGGTEQVIRNLIRASDTERVHMAIFCIEAPLGPWGEALRDEGIPISCHARQPGFDIGVLRALRRHLQTHDVDVVHCHQYTPWVYGCLAAIGLGKRVMFTEHGRFYPDRASPRRRYINPVLARLTDRITAISEATRQALVDYEYLQAGRIEVIYNGIEALRPAEGDATALRRSLEIPDSAPVLGTVARLDPIKNHDMMLEAFRRVADVHPEARLLLVGDGEERVRIEERVTALGLEDRVIMPGYRPNPTVWLSLMDIFLLSSFSEGTSMTLLEAMSLGKPCVVTDVGGNPEIVDDGVTGVVVESDNAEAFAEAILTIITFPERAAELREAALARFEQRFSAATMAGRYLTLYEQ